MCAQYKLQRSVGSCWVGKKLNLSPKTKFLTLSSRSKKIFFSTITILQSPQLRELPMNRVSHSGTAPQTMREFGLIVGILGTDNRFIYSCSWWRKCSAVKAFMDSSNKETEGGVEIWATVFQEMLPLSLET